MWVNFAASVLISVCVLAGKTENEPSPRFFFTAEREKNGCISARKEKGRCIPLELCPILSEKARQFNPIFIIQGLSEYTCGIAEAGLHVCCPERKENTPGQPWGTSPTKSNTLTLPTVIPTGSDAWNTPSSAGSDPWNTPSSTESDPWNTPSSAGSDPWNTPSSTESDPWKTPSSAGSDPWNTPSSAGSDPWNTPSSTESDPWNTPSSGGSDPWNTPSSAGSDPWNIPSSTESDPWNTPSSAGSDPWNTPSSTESDPWNTPSSAGSDPWNTPSSTGSDPWNIPSSTETNAVSGTTQDIWHLNTLPNSTENDPRNTSTGNSIWNTTSTESDIWNIASSTESTTSATSSISGILLKRRNHVNRRLLPEETCGIDVGEKIIGGKDTEIQQHPWLALIRLRLGNGRTTFICGGSIISSRYILTAAHCLRNPRLPPGSVVDQVRLGEWDQSSEVDCQGDVCSPPPEDINVEERIIHPQYRATDVSQKNDIALIRLKTPVNLTRSIYVQPICLPLDDSQEKNYVGKLMTTAGWGKVNNSANSQSPKKLQVELPIIDTEACAAKYRSGDMKVGDTQICAGGVEGKDSCQGDSGGPLMSQDLVGTTVQWQVLGIVSVGPPRCGSKGDPGIYTRVDKYLNWILDNMRD